jgi:hypothetical protein
MSRVARMLLIYVLTEATALGEDVPDVSKS